jgi:hypothetical protein
MSELGFIRGAGGLVPDGDEAAEWFAKVKPGTRIVANVKVPRNGRFHRKFFAMLHIAYENWDKPNVATPFGAATCSAEAFRSDVTIMAGFHELRVNTRGEWRLKAKSIAWANMDEIEFDRLYSAVLDVILAKFLTNWTGDDMNKAVEAFIVGFG